MIQQGGNLSGVNNTNLSISSNNNSNSLPSFNDINWKKKCSHENSSLLDTKNNGNNSSLSNLSGIVPKRQIETLNMRNTFDEKDYNYSNDNEKNNIYNTKNNKNNYNKF